MYSHVGLCKRFHVYRRIVPAKKRPEPVSASRFVQKDLSLKNRHTRADWLRGQICEIRYVFYLSDAGKTWQSYKRTSQVKFRQRALLLKDKLPKYQTQNPFNNNNNNFIQPNIIVSGWPTPQTARKS